MRLFLLLILFSQETSFENLRRLEMEPHRRPVPDYMERVQVDINSRMRGILVDWRIQVAEAYELSSNTPPSLHLLHRSILVLLGYIQTEASSPGCFCNACLFEIRRNKKEAITFGSGKMIPSHCQCIYQGSCD